MDLPKEQQVSVDDGQLVQNEGEEQLLQGLEHSIFYKILNLQ